MKVNNKHSMKYYEDRYNEIRQYASDRGLEQPYNSIESFINDYEYMRTRGVKNIMKEMRYYAQYEVSYGTARTMLQKVREFGGAEKFQELKGMTTQQFAEKYLTELKAAQSEAQSIYGDNYAKYIGIMWFGSK